LYTTCAEVAALEQSLLQRITAARYDLWFRGKTRFTLEPDRLVVGVSNLHYQEWLQKKFADEVRAAAAEVVGQPVSVTFVIDPELFQAQRQSAPMAAPSAVASVQPYPAPPAPETLRRGMRRWRRLDDFVVGSCNRVAHAAALGVVEEPGMVPIPMVLHGPVGSGKSHLLEGIRAGLSDRFPDARIMFLTAEDFTNRFLGAMHQNKQPTFRRQFRECDVLLVDDLQFLAKKTATQVEFLHTLEALQREGRTVVVTCDCHPRLAEIFQPELTDRLVGGAVHGLAWPDPATRRSLLIAKTHGKPALPSDVLDLLTERLRGGVARVHSHHRFARYRSRRRDGLGSGARRPSVKKTQLANLRPAHAGDVPRP
jgi:chromosomal replication initiator protein